MLFNIGIPEWGILPVDPWNFKVNVFYQVGNFQNVASDMQLRGLSKVKLDSVL